MKSISPYNLVDLRKGVRKNREKRQHSNLRPRANRLRISDSPSPYDISVYGGRDSSVEKKIKTPNC